MVFAPSNSPDSTVEPLVVLQGLEYCFGSRTALAGIDLRLEAGQILGLVGPNGSGKTTLLKLLAGLLRPSKGQVRVLGRNPHRERARVMEGARFAFAPPPLLEELSARENLQLITALGGPRSAPSEIQETLGLVGLAERAADRVRTFSMGMKQRLALAQALLPRPRLLVLDEPTDGLDPLAVLDLRAVLLRLRDEHGVTILLSSHLMVEVEHLVDRLLVLMEGRAEFYGTPAELLRDGQRLLLAPEEPDLEAFARHLRASGLDVRELRDGQVALAPDALDLEAARTLAREGGFRLRSFHVQRPHLEAALLERQRRRARGQGPC